MYLYYLHDVINNIDLKEYGDFYGFELDFDDSEIHRKYNIFRGNESQKLQKWTEYPNMNKWYKGLRSDETLKYGLFYSMTQYLFGVFPEIYDFHFNLISDPENELKMEVWMTDFDRNINVILNRLNLIDSPENREILQRNGLEDVDIAAERQELYRRLKAQDASHIKFNDRVKHKRRPRRTPRQIKRFSGNRERGKRPKGKGSRVSGKGLRRQMMKYTQKGHVHSRRNDTKYVDALLGLDPQICLVLKHITNLIEYGWSYAEYC